MGRAKTKARAITPGWVFYGPTSDEDSQAPELSLGSQRRLCTERLIEGSGISQLDEYTDVYSGRSTDRKNYQRLLTDARDGKFSHVLHFEARSVAGTLKNIWSCSILRLPPVCSKTL